MKPSDQTPNADTEVGNFVEIALGQQGAYFVPTDYWDEIDAALHQYVERNIDRVLTIKTLAGSDLLLPVSRIGDVVTSTPEARARNREIARAINAEKGFEDDD
jgi:hypothetical protein